MTIQQGLSGLNGAAKSLDVIGNNIANASTVGFKGSQVQFADVYANSLNSTGNNIAGAGVKVAQIAQQFSQGNVEASANPLDIAISGSGFFRTVTNGTVQFSRNGQFSLDKSGSVVNAQGAKLTGYLAGTDGVILSGSVTPLRIDNSSLQPVATTRVDTKINLDSRSLAPVTSPFNASDPTSYTKQTSINIYDTLGNSHVMSSFYVKSASANSWDMYTAKDGAEITGLKVAKVVQDDPAAAAARIGYAAAASANPQVPATMSTAAAAYATAAGDAITAAAAASDAADAAAIAAGTVPPASFVTALVAPQVVAAAIAAGLTTDASADSIDKAIAAAVPAVKTGTLVFDQNGALTSPTAPATLKFNLPVFPDTGANSVMPLVMGFTGTTQFGSASSETASTQDGYTAGQMTRFNVGADGIILAQYSNGQTHALGQVVLANFANPNGLSPQGNNTWSETSTSGMALVGVPGSSGIGTLQASAVENSNVDLTAELVNMITAQRVYQANAQTIKTQDQVLQTVVNLR